jgi:pectinesterase
MTGWKTIFSNLREFSLNMNQRSFCFGILLSLLATAAPAQTNLYVAADGSARFKSVQAAIMAVPSGSRDMPVVIHIKPGTYHELIYVQREKCFFKLVGDNPANTILSFGLYAGMTNVDGHPIGTFKTPSTTIDADNFTAENLTFENSAGPVGQALALRVDGDRAVFRNCRFLGWQDTILLNRGRQYFENCYIAGHVDFIFGAATAWFEKCEIHARRDGYLTAASTPADQPFGFVFSHCKITGGPGVKTFLGRPWRNYASTIFLNCEMSGVVRPQGWFDWKKPEAHATARYAEFNSTGPGANPAARPDWTRQLTKAEASKIIVEKVLGGADHWNPALDSDFGANRFDIQYGEAGGEKLLLDAHVPAGDGKFPVLLIVHGGGWCAGGREDDIVPVLAPAVTNFTWFTIAYRLAPTNRWPACFEDVQTAIRWVKLHAPEFKGDPDRIALIGYSAGGHLVCLAATDAKPDTRVQAVVGFAPPTDITADAERRGSFDKWPAMEKLLGRDSLDAATLNLMREISPSEHVSADLPPFLLVQGSADTTVPYPLTLTFEARLKKNHVPCDFITIVGATHRIRDWNRFRPGWAAEVAGWLEQHLKPNP